jgi:hypothetical protein
MTCGEDEPVLVGSVDCLFLSREFRLALVANCDIKPDRCLLVATHTHSAPALYAGLPGLGSYDSAWAEEVVNRIGLAVRGLNERNRRFDVTVARQQVATSLSVSRRLQGYWIEYRQCLKQRRFVTHRGSRLAPNPDHNIDSSVRIVAFRDPAGVVKAVIWSFAAHPAFYPERMAVSADFPGAVRAAIRHRYGVDCVVVYFPGLAGSSMPAIPARLPLSAREALKFVAVKMLPFHAGLSSFSPATFRAYSEQLSRVVVDAIGDARELEPPSEADKKTRIASIITKPILISEGGAQPCIELMYLRLTPSLEILALSGEPVCEWSPILCPIASDRTLITGYASGDATYIPTDTVRAEGGYEVSGFMPSFGLSGRFIDGLDRIVPSAVREILAQ